MPAPMVLNYTRTPCPPEKGVYACRVEVSGSPLAEDKFLMWDGEHWYFPWSDQRYRGPLRGWIGPLQRKLETP